MPGALLSAFDGELAAARLAALARDLPGLVGLGVVRVREDSCLPPSDRHTQAA
jgi:hypothetical protein